MQKIGAFFTPIKWGEFAIKKFSIFEKWLQGASIFDPTMGQGNLLFALIDYGLKKGYTLQKLPLYNLYGAEIQKEFFEIFFLLAKKKYSLNLERENFYNEDIFFLSEYKKFDILLGNPPWQSFAGLPENYKKKIKPLFREYGLVQKGQNLLLGFSRIDLAALVIQKTILHHLKPNAEAFFFVPLSLFLGEGVHNHFRNYQINTTCYCLKTIFDFHTKKIFDQVATRYGLAYFLRDQKQTFPTIYYQWKAQKWQKFYANPMFHKNDALSIASHKNTSFSSMAKITIKKYSQPRQGINSCGANDIYFFNSCDCLDQHTCLLTNKNNQAKLPKKYIFPLIVSQNFQQKIPIPQKWVFLPYYPTGILFTTTEIEKEPLVFRYLFQHQKFLQARRGVFIQSFIKKGKWWALLGVGSYNFSFQKIVWQAYGSNRFLPKIFTKNWQANQSLQAFMPTRSSLESNKIFFYLQDKNIEKYLLSYQMAGTMNWAQPGKIKKILVIIPE